MKLNRNQIERLKENPNVNLGKLKKSIKEKNKEKPIEK